MLRGISPRSSCILTPVDSLKPDPEHALDAQEFERQLRANGHAYHSYHPFNVLLNSGRASAHQIRGWVANRFYYHTKVPIKHASVLDQDGHGTDPGSIDAWVRLGQAVGLDANELWSTEHVLPDVRIAVDGYVADTREQPWQEVVCASLTDLFASLIHSERLGTWAVHYPWIEPSGVEYFRTRMSLASRDVQQGLRITLEHFRTREAQMRALDLLRIKLDLLWAMLDSIQLRYGLQDDRPLA